jgi:hypothetical protein
MTDGHAIIFRMVVIMATPKCSKDDPILIPLRLPQIPHKLPWYDIEVLRTAPMGFNGMAKSTDSQTAVQIPFGVPQILVHIHTCTINYTRILKNTVTNYFEIN